jgi:hypothetical protein
VFCPEGYVPTQKAIVIAAQYWFAEELAAITAGATDRRRRRTSQRARFKGWRPHRRYLSPTLSDFSIFAFGARTSCGTRYTRGW